MLGHTESAAMEHVEKIVLIEPTDAAGSARDEKLGVPGLHIAGSVVRERRTQP